MRQLLAVAVVVSAVVPWLHAEHVHRRALATAEVNTTSGLIVGHTAPNRTGVAEFLGIQYGQAPVGKLRFAAPKRYLAPVGEVYNASNWVSQARPWPQVLVYADDELLTDPVGAVRLLLHL